MFRPFCLLALLSVVRARQAACPIGTVCEDRSLSAGMVVVTLDLATPALCLAACKNQSTASPSNGLHKQGFCEAWEFSHKKSTCELRQMTGAGKIGDLGDLSGHSWKRHSNFRGDCTPLWVDIAPKNDHVSIKVQGTQQERDLACCRRCTADPSCEAWSQATNSEDDPSQCWLRNITKALQKDKDKEGFSSGIVGASDNDCDYKNKKPKPYFSERRNMVCSDVDPVERYVCASNTAHADECESFGCCWDATNMQCFKSKWRPVAILHGMGSRLVEYEKNILWLRKAYPGIYVKNLNVYPGPPSMTTLMKPQMERIKESLQSDPMLQHGFNFYGESQGGLLARAFVTKFNNPPVFNLVAISGPQAGVGLCPDIDFPIIKTVCAGGAPVLGIYNWPRCSFCDFWKGESENKYLSKSRYLAELNNDGPYKNQTYIKNMKALNLYMASAGSDDHVVQPRESAWHTYWPWGSRKTVQNWRETDSYKGDWLGLRTLDEQGKLIFNMYEGTHTSYNQTWWLSTVQPIFNNTLPAS